MKLREPLVVAHPETGDIITMFKTEGGEDYGKIRVDQVELVVVKNFSRFSKKSAFITVSGEDALILQGILKEGEPYPIEGHIVVTESTTPSYEGQNPKTKGKDGAVILSNGRPVYRDTEFTTDFERKDILVISDENKVNTPSGGNAAE